MNKRSPQAIILTATRAQAHARGERLGLASHLVLWPRGRADLAGLNHVPLYVDTSLEGHPKHDELADYVAARWRGRGGVGWHPGRLDAEPSLALD